jgi:predicted permease
MLKSLVHDLCDGARIVRTSPGLCAAAALLLALVIGGNTTVYAIIVALVHKPAPAVDPTDLVSIGFDGEPFPLYSYEDYAQYAQQTRTLRSLSTTGIAGNTARPVATPHGRYLLRVAPVTEHFFATIAVRVSPGRGFEADDDREAAALVAVISHRVWREHFDGEASVIGRAITIDGKPATIVGVAPPGFAGPYWGATSDVWVPLRAFTRPTDVVLVGMIGRLNPGATARQTQAEFQVIQARLHSAAADDRSSPILVTPYSATAGSLITASKGDMLAALSVMTLLSLVIVCANVANLFLARAVAGQHATAIRQCLGASPARIVCVFAGEALSIAVLALVGAYGITWIAAALLPRVLPRGPLMAGLPTDFWPDWRVGAYAVGAAFVATLLFSLVPALRMWRVDPLAALKAGARTTATGRARMADTLVVIQVGLSALLLTLAGLAHRSFTLTGINMGFDTERVLLVGVGTTDAARAGNEHRLLLERIRNRLRAIPGVTAITYTNGEPPIPWARQAARVSSSGAEVPVQVDVIGPEFLETLGVEPIDGRVFTAQDRQRVEPVAIINEELARRLWPDRSAAGRTFALGDQQIEVAGIIRDAHYLGFNVMRPDAAPRYVLLSNQPARPAVDGGTDDAAGRATFYIRYSGTLEPITRAVPDAVREVDARVALKFQQTLDGRLNEWMSPARLIAALLLLFACISLVIAALGQYAIVAFTTRRRSRDFAVRIAVGASRQQVLKSVLGEGAWHTVTGLALGLALGAGVATLMRASLFGVQPTDPPTYLVVVATLTVVSLAACYLPARRASRVDPIETLGRG